MVLSIASSPQKLTTPTFNYLLYPNPTNGIVYLDLLKNDDSIQQVNFYNMMGKLILSQSPNGISSNQISFNLSDQPKGLYMVELIGENTRSVKKLIIE